METMINNMLFDYDDEYVKSRLEKIEKERQESIDLEQKRIGDIKCPCCGSTDKINYVKTDSNGVIGPGFSTWIVESYMICKGCGIHYTDLNKKTNE